MIECLRRASERVALSSEASGSLPRLGAEGQPFDDGEPALSYESGVY